MILKFDQRQRFGARGAIIAAPGLYLSNQRRRERATGAIWSYDYDAFGNLIDITRETRNDLVPDPLNLFQGYLALVNDYSFFGFTSPVRGGRSRLQVGGTTGTVDYATVIADYRRYFNPMRNLTLGFRGYHLGNYGRSLENSELQPIPLGFETFIRGYAPESYDVARE